MNKIIQALLLVLVFSFAASARLSILGWLMAIGFGSVAILGLVHFIVHFYCMNNLAVKSTGNISRIIISHLLFASILLFQTDFDDSKTYSVLGNFFNFDSQFLERQGYIIVLIALVVYIFLTSKMVREIRKDRIKGYNLKFLIPSVLLAFILPNVFALTAYRIDEQNATIELESTGEFNSLKRAVNNPKLVETLSLDYFHEPLLEFPSEILKLTELKHLNLKENGIESIPDNIDKLSKMESLNLLDNNLKEINPSICDCSSLIELRIGGEISSIPDCLKKMKTLKHLSLQSNYANELLEDLREFENIETAHFYLKSPDVDFESMTDEQTKIHFENSKKFDSEKWKRMKKETGIKHKY
jgi:hypothetical protein